VSSLVGVSGGPKLLLADLWARGGGEKVCLRDSLRSLSYVVSDGLFEGTTSRSSCGSTPTGFLVARTIKGRGWEVVQLSMRNSCSRGSRSSCTCPRVKFNSIAAAQLRVRRIERRDIGKASFTDEEMCRKMDKDGC
jgi:hypothetical protein